MKKSPSKIFQASACYGLLRILSRGTLPKVLSDPDDIHKILALRSAGLVEAETSRPAYLDNGERRIESAEVTGITAYRQQRRSNRAPSAMPTIAFHGDRDETVSFVNAVDVVEAALGIDRPYESSDHVCASGRRTTRRRYFHQGGEVRGELWTLEGAAPAWSGGSPNGSFTDPHGPNSSEEMWRFFDKRRRRRETRC